MRANQKKSGGKEGVWTTLYSAPARIQTWFVPSTNRGFTGKASEAYFKFY